MNKSKFQFHSYYMIYVQLSLLTHMKYEWMYGVKFAIIMSFADISNAKYTECVAFQYAITLHPFWIKVELLFFLIRNQQTT
jgi:hypothetical protein